MADNAKDIRLRERKDVIAQLNETIRNQNELISSLRAALEASNASNALLTEKIEYLTKKLFGTSSEKRLEIPGQLSLFNEAETEADSAPEPEEQPEAENEPEARKRKKKRTHEETFKGIQVDEELIPLPDDKKFCPECGAELVKVGKEYVRTEFQFTPAKGRIVKYYTETWKCPVCTSGQNPDNEYEFVRSEAPAPLFPHGYASSSVVSWVIYQKYANGAPLYRQEQDWKQLGVPLSRTTMANWIIHGSIEYLLPMYDFFHRELLKRKFLMADETRIQVLKENERNATTDSFMWLVRSGEDGLPPLLLYRYTETRAKYNALELLKGFSGYLETDGYQGYNNLPGVTRCCCWSHVRRYFIDAVPAGKQYDYSNPAVQGVQYCSKLFEYERYCINHKYTPEQRKEYRNRKSRVLLEQFWNWLEAQHPVKGSRFETAVNYAQNRKAHLETYLEDGRCSLSNNLSENAIRPFTVGRKNWLFSDTPSGAQASAIVYTMVEMAKAHELNIYEYLKYLFDHRPSQEMTDDELEKLAPWNPDVREICQRK